MYNTYAYQICEAKAKGSVYFEVEFKNKLLIFLKCDNYSWEFYYKGNHVADILPDTIECWRFSDNTGILYAAQAALENFILDTMTTDESYQIITSVSDF